MSTSEDPVLSQLLKIRTQQEQNCMKAIKALLSLCNKDETIARYLYTLPPPSYQGARFIDWIVPYMKHQRTELSKAHTMSNAPYYEKRLALLDKCEMHMEKFQERCKRFSEEEKA